MDTGWIDQHRCKIKKNKKDRLHCNRTKLEYKYCCRLHSDLQARKYTFALNVAPVMPFIKAAAGLRNMRAPNPEIAVSPNVFFFFLVPLCPHLCSITSKKMLSHSVQGECSRVRLIEKITHLHTVWKWWGCFFVFVFLRLMISQPQNAPSTFSASGARKDSYTDYFLKV